MLNNSSVGILKPSFPYYWRAASAALPKYLPHPSCEGAYSFHWDIVLSLNGQLVSQLGLYRKLGCFHEPFWYSLPLD